MSIKEIALYAVVALITFVGGYLYFEVNHNTKTPEQPIEFSHVIHATDNQIPCMYCHLYAERSKVSGVPNVKRCMGCHQYIKTDSPEIQKIHKAWEDQTPIEWVKVHNLPDFVYFPHKRHIKAEVKCQTCHGDVQDMPRVSRAPAAGLQPSLTMGWCLQCHRTVDMSEGRVSYEAGDKGLNKFGLRAGEGVENGRDCWTCHK